MVGVVVALALLGLAWPGGILGGFGVAVGNDAIAQVGTFTPIVMPSGALWRGAVFSLEPAAMHVALSANPLLAAASPFSSPAPPSFAYLAWCVAWVTIVVALAIWSFDRREI